MQQATRFDLLKCWLVPGGVGQKRKVVVGNAFALAANKISAQLEGNTGYMLLKTVSTELKLQL